MAALGKGWSLFSSAVAGASRVVSENIIQPGMEKATDPTLIAAARGYVSEAGRVAGDVGQTANTWSKSQLGVDVGAHVGGMVETLKQTVAGPGVGSSSRSGYSSISSHADDYHDDSSSALYAGDHDGDFFAGVDHRKSGQAETKPPQAKHGDDWDDDEWKDF